MKIYSSIVIRKALELHKNHYNELLQDDGLFLSGTHSMNDIKNHFSFNEIFFTIWDGKDLTINRIPEFLHYFIKEAELQLEVESLDGDAEFQLYLKLNEKYKHLLNYANRATKNRE